MRWLECFLCLTLTASSAFAESKPFGASGLPYYAAHAKLIIETRGDATLEYRGTFARIVSVGVAKSLLGAKFEEPRIFLLVPGRGSEAESAKSPKEFGELNRSTVFLKSEVSAEDLQSYGLSPQKAPVWALVSAKASIPLDDEKKQSSVTTFLALSKNPKEREDWVRKALASDDLEINRWALFEAYTLVNKGELGLSKDLSKLATGSCNPNLTTLVITNLTVLRLQANEQKDERVLLDASRGLVSMVGDPRIPFALRHQAYSGLPTAERTNAFEEYISNPENAKGSRPVVEMLCGYAKAPESQKSKLITDWRRSKDPERKGWGDWLARSTDVNVQLDDASVSRIVERINSGDPLEKSRALKELCNARPSKATLDLAWNILLREDEVQSARGQAIDVLASWSTKQSIELLAKFANDEKQSIELRTLSVLAIGRVAEGLGDAGEEFTESSKIAGASLIQLKAMLNVNDELNPLVETLTKGKR